MEDPHLIQRHKGLLFFHKPAGFASHPGGLHSGPNMVDWIRKAFPEEGEVSPVHRLDLETSGVFAAAGSDAVRAEAGDWFSSGQIQKTYLTLVRGRCRKKGTIQRALRSHSGKKMEEARTSYKTIEWIGPYSLLEVQPHSGRKHQIRRHLNGIGHPVAGDKRYGTEKKERGSRGAPRTWLHAWKLKLPDGTVVEDPLPADLLESLQFLREKYAPRITEATDLL